MSTLTITDVEAWLLEGPRPWLLVRVHTDAGVTGIGEIARTTHIPEDVVRLGENLIGQDPFETEACFGAGGALGADPHDRVTTAMTGGLDIACWDVKGKHLDVPVHHLLGGPIRDHIRVYTNGWDFRARSIVDDYHSGGDPATVLEEVRTEITDAAESVVDAGYTALKFSPFQWGDGPTTSKRELDHALAVVEAVYETAPRNVELLIEGHCHLSIKRAIAAARRLERFNPGFYEEPVPAEYEPLRRVARASPIPIATGESFATHRGFAELIARTDVAVVQPDVSRAGGITELRKIAAMASADRVAFAPHNAAGPVQTYAALHIDAVTPAFSIQETFEESFHPEWATDLLVDPLSIQNGRVERPDRPGLGVELDDAILHERTIAHAAT